MSAGAAQVVAVTVTYGRRAGLLAQALAAVAATGVRRAFVVDNGSPEDNADAVRALAQTAGLDVTVVRHEDNRGSAAGFAAGIGAALAADPEALVWLLDDDNAPAAGALDALLGARRGLPAPAAERTVLLSYRSDRRYQRELVHGRPTERVFPRRGSFAGFNVLDVPRKVASRLRPAAAVPAGDPIEIPYGPYSGLLIPAGAIRAAGLPDADLVLYEDDAEFTCRLRSCGARLYLVPGSEIVDLDASWYVESPGRTPFGKLLNAPSERRVYYTVRNRIVFEQRHWGGAAMLRTLNRCVLHIGLTVVARLSGSSTRLHLLRRAIADGERERLGQPVNLRLSSSS